MGLDRAGYGKIKSIDNGDVNFAAVYRDYLTVSVRRIDIWAYYSNSFCPDGEWIGSGTAFDINSWITTNKENGGVIDNKNVWVTADHILFLQYYDPNITKIAHLRIDGLYDVIPMARHPLNKIGVVLSNDLPFVIPMGWWDFSVQSGSLKANKNTWINKDDWKIGEEVYIPFYTLSELCVPKTYEELFRNCITEFMMVDKGYIASAQNLDGILGGEITITSNLIGGSSGAPYLLFRPSPENKGQGTNVKDFQLLAVENSGFRSGIAIGQQFTLDTYNTIDKSIKDLNSSFWTK